MPDLEIDQAGQNAADVTSSHVDPSHVANARAGLRQWVETYTRDSVISADVTQLNAITAAIHQIETALNSIKE